LLYIEPVDVLRGYTRKNRGLSIPLAFGFSNWMDTWKLLEFALFRSFQLFMSLRSSLTLMAVRQKELILVSHYCTLSVVYPSSKQKKIDLSKLLMLSQMNKIKFAGLLHFSKYETTWFRMKFFFALFYLV